MCDDEEDVISGYRGNKCEIKPKFPFRNICMQASLREEIAMKLGKFRFRITDVICQAYTTILECITLKKSWV